MYHTGRDDNEHRIILTSDYNFFVQVGFTLFTVVVKVEFEVPRSDKSKNVCLLSVLMRPTRDSRFCIGNIAHNRV